MSLNLDACNRVTPKLMSEDFPDWKNISQFQSVSAAGPHTIWVVTSRGDLHRVSKQGEQRKVDDAGPVAVVSFLDSSHGWVVDRKSQIWKTTDGGNSWQIVCGPQPGNRGFYLPQQLTFVDELHGWLVGIFQVWQTVDGGRTWHEKFSISTSEERVGRLYRGAFIRTQSGWIAASGGVVIRTNDGGLTWQTVTPVSKRADLHDIALIDEQSGWIIGRPEGGVLRTEDGGTTWQNLLTNLERRYFNSVCFPTKVEGWAVGWRVTGDEVQDREGVVFHTLDGGRNWRSALIGGHERFFDRVLFSDVHHGWLVARDVIYYTDDGGTTWNTLLKLSPVKVAGD